VPRTVATRRYGLPPWATCLGALALIVCALAVYIPIARARWRRGPGGLGSCRNHASFLGHALDQYLLQHRQLPYDPAVPGEELVCRLDVQGALGNCQLGAPGQRVGGWQMVNASPQTWDEILRSLKEAPIPVMWCGKAHEPGGNWKGTVRIVFAIGVHGDHHDSVAELIDQNVSADDGGRKSLYYFYHGIVYGMQEQELIDRLAAVNAILRQSGEPETPLNVEGGRDYEAIASPYQANP